MKTTTLISIILALCPWIADAHPGAGIVADQTGRIFFLDTLGGRLWMLEPGQSPVPVPPGTSRLGHPHHLLLDAEGNLYVASDGSGEVWKFGPGGVDPKLFYPPPPERGIGIVGAWGDPFTIDKNGAIYFVNARFDKTSQIVKIDSSGKLSLFAGGDWGFADGIGDRAKFRNLHAGAMVWGVDGWLYVTDGGRRIRKIGPDGLVLTLAGGDDAGFADGGAEDARFSGVMGIAFDSQGNLIAADTENRRIRSITPDGRVTTIAGSGLLGSVDGSAFSASFEVPSGVAVSGNTTYVLDYSLFGDAIRIRSVSPEGKVSTLASVAVTP